MYVVRQVAQKLINAGIKVKSLSEWEHSQDGEIELLKGYSVQVGTNYLCLNRNHNINGELNSVSWILEDTNVEGIIKYFKDMED